MVPSKYLGMVVYVHDLLYTWTAPSSAHGQGLEQCSQRP